MLLWQRWLLVRSPENCSVQLGREQGLKQMLIILGFLMLSPRGFYRVWGRGIIFFPGLHDSLPFHPAPSQAGCSPGESRIFRYCRQKVLGESQSYSSSRDLFRSQPQRRAHTRELAHLPTQRTLFATCRWITVPAKPLARPQLEESIEL